MTLVAISEFTYMVLAISETCCAIVTRNKTRQGYARKRTLKLAGYFFLASANGIFA